MPSAEKADGLDFTQRQGLTAWLRIMTTRVSISAGMITWARERAGVTPEALAARFGKSPEWESGETRPTLKQIERFARFVHVPVGYLFLDEPPSEEIPIPDFRTMGGRGVTRPSPNLLDVIYACQERQSWYGDFVRDDDRPALGFIGEASLETPVEEVAARMRKTLGFSVEARKAHPTWSEALREFMRQVEATGALVMVSGIVGSNTNRKLDPDEFRGFALVDSHAPLIFVNGADYKAAQMFTLAHELAHLWLGTSALSDAGVAPAPGCRAEEVWCNAVAAEFLVPLDALRDELRQGEPREKVVRRLAATFKVSRLVILRRLKDARWMSPNEFESALEEEEAHFEEWKSGGKGGGDFYRTTLSRVGRRFARALVVSTMEGGTLYRDAFRMLGISKTKTFNQLGREVGVMG